MRTQVFRAAAVQATPVFLNREATVDKTCRLIREAAEQGCRLIVFPEAFIPGFPFWPKDPPRSEREKVFEAFSILFRNSVEVPGPDTQRLGEAARDAGAYVVVGINERERPEAGGGTLYNTLLFFSPDGKLLGKHRKLVCTYHERCVWGQGDGSGLQVFDTDVGRLSGLICYEHQMPLVKYALFSKGEQIHAAVWPNRAYINPVIDAAIRQYAFEGQTFVVSACSYMTEDQVPNDFPLRDETLWDADGGSAIVSPLGKYLAGPVFGKEEIVSAEIDLGLIVRAKAFVDSVGHYSRPDVVRLLLNEQRLSPVAPVGEAVQTYGGGIPEAVESLQRHLVSHPSEEVRAALQILRRLGGRSESPDICDAQ